jgi:hypothetical protein
MVERDSPEKDTGVKLATVYDTVERRLATIWNAIDAIDTKTNIILGFASVVLAVLVGFFSTDPNRWQTFSLVLFFIALLSYIALVILSVLSYRVAGWSYRPDPNTLMKHCKDGNHSVNDIREWVIDECTLACNDNLAQLQKKAHMTNLVLYLFATETVLLVIGLAYSLVA